MPRMNIASQSERARMQQEPSRKIFLLPVIRVLREMGGRGGASPSAPVGGDGGGSGGGGADGGGVPPGGTPPPPSGTFSAGGGDSPLGAPVRPSSEKAVVDELLRQLKSAVSAQGFHLLCRQLLEAMGFTRLRMSESANFRGDGGFSGAGLLRAAPENPLVATRVAFECRRHAQAPVDVMTIRSLQAKIAAQNVADCGVVLATSDFTQAAREEADLGGRLELVNGDHLARLMVENLVGVRVVSVRSHKGVQETMEVDKEFFARHRE